MDVALGRSSLTSSIAGTGMRVDMGLALQHDA